MRRARPRIIALALAAALAVPALLAGLAAADTGQTIEGVPQLGHVFLIVGENTTYSHLDATVAPYLETRIRPASAWLTNYYAATHWSQANYTALISGEFSRCDQQDYGIACHRNVDNLFHQIDVAGETWKTWLEGGSAKCDTGSGSTCAPQGPCPLTGFYTTGNPAILYDDIEGENGVWSETNRSQECLQNDIYASAPTDSNPMQRFDDALAAGSVPRFNLVLPNGCEDGEANCKPINNRLTQFDAFLAREVPKIMASPAFGSDGVIVVTYDEDQRAGGLAKKNGLGSGGHVVCAIISPLVQPGEYGTKAYHYSVLRTVEDGLGLAGHVGDANAVAPITGIWR